MAHGMDAFSKGPVYGGMMKSFQKAFGDSMVDLPTGKVSEVDFGKTCSWAGVTFEFRHGASTDFPAASIIIGGKVYYTHWVPAKAHVAICRCLLALPFILSKWDESRHFWGKIPFVICSSCFPAMLKAGRG